MDRKNIMIKFAMAKITPEEIENRTRYLSPQEKADIESWSDFINDGDTMMALHIFREMSRGAKTAITGLLALIANSNKEK